MGECYSKRSIYVPYMECHEYKLHLHPICTRLSLLKVIPSCFIKCVHNTINCIDMSANCECAHGISVVVKDLPVAPALLIMC